MQEHLDMEHQLTLRPVNIARWAVLVRQES